MIVIETNLRQLSFTDLSHSERAYYLAEHYKILKKQGQRNDILLEVEKLLKSCDIKENPTSAHNEQKLESRDKIAKENGISRATTARYIRIATLDKTLIELLDNGDIAFLTAYTLSFIEDKEKQSQIVDLIESENYKVDVKKAELLREYYAKSQLSEKVIEQILNGEKDKKPKSNTSKPVQVKKSMIIKYFTANESPKEIEETIEKALAMYFELLKSQDEVQGNDEENEDCA